MCSFGLWFIWSRNSTHAEETKDNRKERNHHKFSFILTIHKETVHIESDWSPKTLISRATHSSSVFGSQWFWNGFGCWTFWKSFVLILFIENHCHSSQKYLPSLYHHKGWLFLVVVMMMANDQIMCCSALLIISLNINGKLTRTHAHTNR